MTTSANPAVSGGGEAEDLIGKIAQLTRMLRDSMRELGLDHAIKEAAEAIPDARDRLGYVARMTEQAANRVLNAAETVQPVQERMQRRARELDVAGRPGSITLSSCPRRASWSMTRVACCKRFPPIRKCRLTT